MGHIEIGVLPPEADAQRQVAADFLTQSMKSLRVFVLPSTRDDGHKKWFGARPIFLGKS